MDFSNITPEVVSDLKAGLAKGVLGTNMVTRLILVLLAWGTTLISQSTAFLSFATRVWTIRIMSTLAACSGT